MQACPRHEPPQCTADSQDVSSHWPQPNAGGARWVPCGSFHNDMRHGHHVLHGLIPSPSGGRVLPEGFCSEVLGFGCQDWGRESFFRRRLEARMWCPSRTAQETRPQSTMTSAAAWAPRPWIEVLRQDDRVGGFWTSGALS